MKEHNHKPNQQPKKPKLILSILFIVGLVSATLLISGIIHVVPKSKTVQLPPQPGYYKVTNVNDGDTITVLMDGREEKVRMIGVDTPETVKPNSPVECYGVAASNYTKAELSNKSVRLESDPINQNRDRYDRLLRYVYLSDGSLFNKTLIEQGYGFAYLSFPFTKAEEFRLAQVDARQANMGVWSGECEISGSDSERPKTNEL